VRARRSVDVDARNAACWDGTYRRAAMPFRESTSPMPNLLAAWRAGPWPLSSLVFFTAVLGVRRSSSPSDERAGPARKVSIKPARRTRFACSARHETCSTLSAANASPEENGDGARRERSIAADLRPAARWRAQRIPPLELPSRQLGLSETG